MRTILLSLYVFCFFFFVNSCSSNQTATEATADGAEVPEEIWGQGIYRIFGTVTSVQALEGSQLVILKEKEGTEYRAMVRPENLGDKAFQYRIFTIGEEIGFKGTLNSEHEMRVTEILEVR